MWDCASPAGSSRAYFETDQFGNFSIFIFLISSSIGHEEDSIFENSGYAISTNTSYIIKNGIINYAAIVIQYIKIYSIYWIKKLDNWRATIRAAAEWAGLPVPVIPEELFKR